uniref:Uncharacterized protein n=1 Tax=Panagrolaimus davidi TaxID=227884 RepID=A0A914R8F6_9BILA
MTIVRTAEISTEIFQITSKITIPKWPPKSITGTLYIREENHFSQFISKCLICDLKCLIFYFWEIQKISYDDFKVLTSSGRLEILDLGPTIVTSKNGEIIPYDSLLDHTPALRYLRLEYNQNLQLSQKFIEKICASNLEYFKIFELPENFESEALLAYLAKGCNILYANVFYI